MISLCHSIAGNAWLWLQLHYVFVKHSRDLEQARNVYRGQTEGSSPEGRYEPDTYLRFLSLKDIDIEPNSTPGLT